MARRVKKTTNNPLRGSMSWIIPARTSFRRGTMSGLGLGKRGVRRLIKRDPAKGITQPYYDRVTDASGVQGLSGASSVKTMSKARQAAPNAGKKVIQDRGTNKSLKKR